MAGCEASTGVRLFACPFAYHRLHPEPDRGEGCQGGGGRAALAAESRLRRLALALPRAVVMLAGRRGCGANPRGRDRNSPTPRRPTPRRPIATLRRGALLLGAALLAGPLLLPAGLSRAGLSPTGLSRAGLSPAGLSPAGPSPAGLSPAGLSRAETSEPAAVSPAQTATTTPAATAPVATTPAATTSVATAPVATAPAVAMAMASVPTGTGTGAGAGTGAAARSPLFQTLRWQRLAERLAHAEITYQICGWGFRDLRTPLAAALLDADSLKTAYPDILRHFDATLQERQRQETQLAAAAAAPPLQRRFGLHATAGCPETLRQQIETLPQALPLFLENLW